MAGQLRNSSHNGQPSLAISIVVLEILLPQWLITTHKNVRVIASATMITVVLAHQAKNEQAR